MAKEKASKINGIPVYCSYDKPVDLVDLVEHPSNPNKHGDKQIALLSKIIRNQGWRNPVIVSKRSGFIVAGHGRLAAAKLLNVDAVPVDYQDFANEAEEHAHLIADNRIAELAEIDSNELAGLLRDLEGKIDLDLTGFDEVSLDDILTATEPEAAEVDAEPQIDKAEELQAKWKTELGQVWELGDHRLFCGDCLDFKIEKQVALLLTDPPYGIKRDKGFGGSRAFGGGKAKPIKSRTYSDEWDDERPSVETFEKIQNESVSAIIFGGNFFADILPASKHWIVWDKKNTMPTFGDCELAWTNIDRTSVVKYEYEYNGLIGKEKQRFHPTQKPVNLFTEIVKDYTNPSDTVYDPFLGSGTTLIACENLKRKCYGVELNPGYVAVILQRWADATGREPKLCS